METLRAFVKAFLKDGTYHSKPDTLSASFELRRLKLRRIDSDDPAARVNDDWPETDFYEYYWAHQMYGTTVSHIWAWLRRLMWQGLGVSNSDDPRYHPRLGTLVLLVWLIVVAALLIATVAVVLAHLGGVLVGAVGGAAAIAVIFWNAIQGSAVDVLGDFVGDAARYFDVAPRNVARRYDILRGGVDMLQKLHEDRDLEGDEVMYRYGRVVLIGHSLGSVISYDILRHYWHEVNGRIEVNPADFAAVENFAGSNGAPTFADAKPYTDPAEYRRRQHEVLCQLNVAVPSGVRRPAKQTPDKGAPHARWLVTDLVTLGCPMTYAPILLAKDIKDFDEKLLLRELPTCPPDRSHNLNPGHFTVTLSAEADRIKDFDILPQGAYFALTRWTNIYFDNDPIGGPVGNCFGNGIEDLEVPHGALGRIRAHVSYWDKERPDSAKVRDRLQEILKNSEPECRT